MAGSRGRKRPPDRRSKEPQPAPPRSRWKRLLVWAGSLTLVAIGVLAIFVAFAARSLPSYSQLMQSQVGQTIVVRARDGREIVTLGPSPGEWLTWDEIPQVMKDAMISVEDRRFYSHFGIDPLGLARAVYVSLRDESRPAATSTITQQLARNIFLNSNRTIDRKVKEAILAMALEWRFSKKQILELYLNKVYFGGGAYGVDSASRKFFSHSAKYLSVSEAAIIAGLVKAPSRYSPTADVNAAVRRANVVLALMRENGTLPPGARDTADPSSVRVHRDTGENSIRYFTDWALPQLDILLPTTMEPLQVWTTLDIDLQKAATDAVTASVPRGAQGALVSLDRDGAILAMVGGTDYVSSNYNRATSALRQPGSAWKLFVYLAALEAGYIPDDRVNDEPVTIQGWTPHNSGRSYAGQIDVRTAFAYSKNTVAAQLGNDVGFGSVASMARRFGISSPVNTMPSMVLGTSEVRVIDMARAFAAVSSKGYDIEPYGIVRVETTGRQVLYKREEPRSRKLVADYVAAGMTDLLQTAVNVGTGKAAQIGRPVAGKTGTTSSNKDGWFIGFSSGITTAVWMGRDDARPVPGLQGGSAPARAFALYMRKAVARRPVENFDTELKLPEWQLEPDDEYNFGERTDAYYYVDERGNLIDPNHPDAIVPDAYPLPPQPQPPYPPPQPYGPQGQPPQPLPDGPQQAPEMLLPPGQQDRDYPRRLQPPQGDQTGSGGGAIRRNGRSAPGAVVEVPERQAPEVRP